MTDYQAIQKSPIGLLGIETDAGVLRGIHYLAGKTKPLAPADELSRRVVSGLERYFDDPAWRFSLPLRPRGTPFQQSVWRLTQEIPGGEARTYGNLAKVLKSSPRAVGNACRANPIPIVIPCHRVVGADGPGGYAGQTAGKNLEIKLWLLAHEKPA